MFTMKYHSLVWFFTLFIKRLGMVGIVGVTIVILTLSINYLKINPIKIQIAKMQATRLQQSNSDLFVKKMDVNLADNQLRFEKKLNEFHQVFQSVENLPQYLELISQAAIKEKLLFSKGRYKFLQSKTTKNRIEIGQKVHLIQYHISLPLTGDYPQIRKFITRILSENPALAITSIQIIRDDILSNTVEARMELLLFMRDEK